METKTTYIVNSVEFLSDEDALLYKRIKTLQDNMRAIAKDVAQLKSTCKHSNLVYESTVYDDKFEEVGEDEYGATKYKGDYINYNRCKCCGQSVVTLKTTGEILSVW